MWNLFVLAYSLTAFSDPHSAAVTKEFATFLGQWKVQWVEFEGKKVEGREAVFSFRGKKLLIGEHEEASLEIDPTCVTALGGRLDYREEPAKDQAGGVCLTYEFDNLEVANKAASCLRELGEHVEGPVDYGK